VAENPYANYKSKQRDEIINLYGHKTHMKNNAAINFSRGKGGILLFSPMQTKHLLQSGDVGFLSGIRVFLSGIP
jgi:hypothetical protein